MLDNLRAVERRDSIIDLSAAWMGNNPSDNIASASYSWAPTERQQSWWALSELYINELYHIVTELSLIRSVFSICLCIQLHKYACIVSQIWFFWFNVTLESIFKTPECALRCLYFRQTFESDYPASQFLPPCPIQNLWTPHCSRLWPLPKIDVSLFVIWASLLWKSSLLLGGL